MEYPGLCSVTAGMLIKKGGFVMCKRKIKTMTFSILICGTFKELEKERIMKGTIQYGRSTCQFFQKYYSG